MRIALITIWHERNYGAELQTYATIKALTELGHTVELVDIRLSDIEQRSLKGKVASFLERLTVAERKFNNFWSRYVPFTRRYTTKEELYNHPPVADIYLVGSDQVWNPDITKDLTEVFFLKFGDRDVKRISYASSFGTETWNYPEIKDSIAECLKSFNAITCREESGVQILNKEFDVDAKCVLDPTLLFSSYPELTGAYHESNTLVYYPLHNDPNLERCALLLANTLRLHPVNNKAQKRVLGNLVWDCNSVEEWVRNIAKSKFVLTRSFHGLAFSLIYKRQFAIIGSKNNRSTRIDNLLKKLDLEDRYFVNESDLEKSKPWEKIIDYNAVSVKLHNLREESWVTLIQMLNK